MKSNLYLFALLFSVLITSCETAEKKQLELSKLFSDHMVLQQNQEVAVWGGYTPGQIINLKGSWGEEVSVTSDGSGLWETKLLSPAAGGPHQLKVITADSTIVIDDILFGEVWLASGQSNMQMSLKGWPPNDPILNSAEEIAGANYPEIRMFTVARNMTVKPVDHIEGQWKAASPETAGDFSASAYFFARRLHQELNVPIGIVHSSWGGTAAEAWTSSKTLRELGDFDQELDAIEKPGVFDQVDQWFAQWPSKEFPTTEEEWQNVDFSDAEVPEPVFDDSDWIAVELPGRIDLINEQTFDGVVWLRKEFDLSEQPASDYTMSIGAIDDMDATYINGQKIGGLAGQGYWNVPRTMKVPQSLLKKGKNIIAIRVIDTGGGGSVGGPIELSNAQGVISLEGTWRSTQIAEIYMNKFYVYDPAKGNTGRPEIMQMNPNIPSVLYNAMMHPLVPYTIKGVIWYQGESNVGRDEQYKRLFPAMIGDWRQKWEYEFPFYFVQIAPYLYNPDPDRQVSQKLREAQRHSLKTANTGMVVTLDIGNPSNIHPANKRDVGSRLAGLALANDYGKDLVASGPLYKGFKTENSKLSVEFDFVGSGLFCPEKELTGFEIAGKDQVYVPARAKIKDNVVVLSHPNVKMPEYVRYAWRDDSHATLFNIEGLPASSFSSEEK